VFVSSDILITGKVNIVMCKSVWLKSLVVMYQGIIIREIRNALVWISDLVMCG